TDNIADRAIRILHAHVDNAAVIRHAVKCSVNRDTAFAEFCLYIKRHLNIRPVLVGDFLYDSVKFVDFRIHVCVPPASSANFSAVLAFLIVTALYATLLCTIFDQRVWEKVATGADQKMTLP